MKYLKYSSILIIVLLGCSPQSPEQTEEIESTATRSLVELMQQIPSIDTGDLIQYQVMESIKCSGQIDVPPNGLYSVHARTAGFITNIEVLPGDRVRKGQLVAQVENPEFIPRQRQLLELQAELDLADKNLKRQQTLIERDATTSTQYDKAYADRQLLEARYNGLISELRVMGFDTDRLLEQKTYQEVVRVVSPATGYVQSVDVNSGQMVEPSQRIAMIVSYEHMHLELAVLERHAPYVQVGDSVVFSLTGSSRQFTADVVKIGATFDSEKGATIAHCHMADDTDLSVFKPGMFVQARLLNTSELVVGLPTAAVVKSGLRYFGYVVEGEEVVRVQLDTPVEHEGFVAFDPGEALAAATWITNGVYYLE